MDRERVDPASLLRDGIEPLSPGVVTIVEFSDFQCGHCAHNHFLMKELHERHPDSVRILHRNFPLDVACNEALQQSVHRFACRAAEAAECASLQGKYEPMADLLFENQRQLFEANLFRLAGKAGLDAEAFASCMESHETMPTIRADTKLGTRLEITSTPTFFIEGRRISGSLPSEAQYDYALLIELTEKATGAQATPPQTSRAPTLSPASRATPHDLAFAQAPLTAPTCNGTVAGPGIVCDSGILPEPLHRAWLLSLVQRLLLYVSAPVPGTRVPGATETT
jgi:protein-disulfide isomerase